MTGAVLDALHKLYLSNRRHYDNIHLKWTTVEHLIITGLPLVREKSGKFNVRKKSGNQKKSQGNLEFLKRNRKFTINKQILMLWMKILLTHLAPSQFNGLNI